MADTPNNVLEHFIDDLAVMPDQYHSRQKLPASLTQLARAVLGSALQDILKGLPPIAVVTERNRRDLQDHFEAAWHWVFEEEAGHWPFCFERVCDTLSIDPDWFRSKLKRHIAGLPPRRAGRPTFYRPDGVRGTRVRTV